MFQFTLLQAINLSLISSAVFIGIYLSILLIMHIIKFVNDDKYVKHHPLNSFVMVLLGYTVVERSNAISGGYFPYCKNNSEYLGAYGFLIPFMISIYLPPIYYIVSNFTMYVIIVICAISGLFLTRGVIRLQKILVRHVNNLKIHNQEK